MDYTYRSQLYCPILNRGIVVIIEYGLFVFAKIRVSRVEQKELVL